VECRKSVLTFWIVRSPVHEHANPPQTFRLLRAGSERPGSRTAKKGNELATLELSKLHPLPQTEVGA